MLNPRSASAPSSTDRGARDSLTVERVRALMAARRAAASRRTPSPARPAGAPLARLPRARKPAT